MSSRNRLLVNREAILANIGAFQSKLGASTSLMAVLKADAYGVGSALVSPLLEEAGVTHIALQEVSEAKAIRSRLPILVLSYTLDEVEEIVRGGYLVCVNDPQLIDQLQHEARRQDKQVGVHLAIDSGLNRIGCQPSDAPKTARHIQGLSHLRLEGVMSHFSSSDLPEQDGRTVDQAARLLALQEKIEAPWWHLSNTGGASRFSWPRCNLARIGIGLYGLASSQAVREAIDLRPALTLESKIVEIRRCEAGDAVSYGATYTFGRKSLVGVVPIGYADGIHMHHSNRGAVSIGGKKVPIIGLICMDFLMVDLTDLPQAVVGDRVVLFGEDLPVHEVAERVGTTVHQLITCIGPRVERSVV